MRRDDLISSAYLAEQVQLHAKPKGYGGRGDKWTQGVLDLVARFEARSVLDYGCGQGALARSLRAPIIGADSITIQKMTATGPSEGHPFTVAEYDPARPGLDELPAPADLVVCTDVLEHIEPDKLGAVIDHLRGLTQKALFAVVATRPANKHLSDGRNAHLILKDGVWWTRTLTARGFQSVRPVPKSPMKKPSREVVLVLV